MVLTGICLLILLLMRLFVFLLTPCLTPLPLRPWSPVSLWCCIMMRLAPRLSLLPLPPPPSSSSSEVPSFVPSGYACCGQIVDLPCCPWCVCVFTLSSVFVTGLRVKHLSILSLCLHSGSLHCILAVFLSAALLFFLSSRVLCLRSCRVVCRSVFASTRCFSRRGFVLHYTIL